jgi:hypothetical protein
MVDTFTNTRGQVHSDLDGYKGIGPEGGNKFNKGVMAATGHPVIVSRRRVPTPTL